MECLQECIPGAVDAEFMGQPVKSTQDDQELFGQLPVPATQVICISLSKLLDHFWEQAKQEARDNCVSRLCG